MIDIEQLVRETLERHEADVPMLDPVHVHPLAVRTRRRQVANSIGAGLVALFIVLGAISGVGAILRSEGERPAIEPVPIPTPSISLPVGPPRDGIAFTDGLTLYTINPDGSGRRQVMECSPASCSLIQEPAWSPDGTMIAFAMFDSDEQTSDIWVVSSDGTELARVTDCIGRFTGPIEARAGCEDHDPAWSPDGSTIVFTRNYSLHTVKVDGSELRALGDRISGASDPAWSPDGTRIAFAGSSAGHDSVYVMNADGSDLQRTFDGPSGSGPGAPGWSPDGTKIVFFHTPRAQGGFLAEVWVMNADGSGRTRLFRGDCCIDDWGGPVWSPDGRQVAFVVNEGAGGRLVVVDADGGPGHTVTTAQGDISWR